LHQVGTSSLLIYMMHGHTYIKSLLVSSVGSFFSYINDARSHEHEAS